MSGAGNRDPSAAGDRASARALGRGLLSGAILGFVATLIYIFLR